MPAVLDPAGNERSMYVSEDKGYEYPEGLNLRPDSDLHKKLVNKIYNRARESSFEMKKRYDSWRSIDHSLTAYVPLDEAERITKQKDTRKPVSIVVPYSYATLETLLTYFTTAFLEMPIFRYEGASPEDLIGAILLEKVVEHHSMYFKHALSLHTQFRDGLAYGFGAVAGGWDRKWGYTTKMAPDGFFSQIFGKFINMGMKKERVEDVLYEGNTLKNIDPYLYLPDPNYPVHEVQKGEFVGWIETMSKMRLLDMERDDPSVFNCRYLETNTQGYSQFNFTRGPNATGRYDKASAGSYPPAPTTTTPIDVIWMYVNLIPREWELGSSEYPEKWLFGMAYDKLIITAKPLGLNHDMYPVAVLAPDFDGYSTSPISRLEVLYGLQETLDWLFSSHITNVRKAINDMLIVDPSLVNVADLEDPKPGKLIRMRRMAWGKGVENAVKQLPVTDITRQHISDAGYIVDLIQRVSAATDSVSGVIRKTSERVTAQESRSTQASALSRLAKSAKIASLQSMFDIGYMFASQTQQLMEKSVYIKTTGAWREMLLQEYGADAQRLKVTPYDLVVSYDLIVKDGSVQSSEQADNWVQLFQIVAQQPALFQNFDVVRIFKHIARVMGAKDVNEFVIQHGPIPMLNPQVTDQGTIDKGVQQGNLVPAGALPGM